MTETKIFRADIQGLRAVAVVGVLIFHATSGRWLPGGFAGVDVFFVISGFLITGILAGADGSPKPSLGEFYKRRIRRLGPALVVMLAAVLCAGAVLLPPDDYAAVARMAVASLLFWSNMMLVQAPSYFDASGELKPLQHTWSLGVEEQFYLLFPIVLGAVSILAPRRRLLVVILAALASLAVSVLLLQTRPTAAFYTLPSRAFELLIGAALALWSGPSASLDARGRDLLSLGGLAVIAAAFVGLGPETPFPGAAALLPCLGCAAVIAAGRRASSAGGRLISGPAFLFLGAISYSLYLWHWPVLVFVRHWTLGPPGPVPVLVAVAASVLLAWASWRWVERPILRATDARTLRLTVVSMAAILTASLAIAAMRGLPQRLTPDARTLLTARTDYNPRRTLCHSDADREAPYSRACAFGADAPPSIAVWGDSQGAELALALGDLSAPAGRSVLQLTASACPPALDFAPTGQTYCARHNAEAIARLIADPAMRDVVLAARYERQADRAPEFLAALEVSVRRLRAAGKRVVILGPLPTHDHDPPAALAMRAMQGRDLAVWGLSRDAYRRRNAAFVTALPDLAARTGAAYVDPFAILCRPDLCPAWSAERGVMYFDPLHLSLAGTRDLAPGVLRQIPTTQPPVNWRAAAS